MRKVSHSSRCLGMLDLYLRNVGLRQLFCISCIRMKFCNCLGFRRSREFDIVDDALWFSSIGFLMNLNRGNGNRLISGEDLGF
jgi:hypothetical protein